MIRECPAILDSPDLLVGPASPVQQVLQEILVILVLLAPLVAPALRERLAPLAALDLQDLLDSLVPSEQLELSVLRAFPVM